MPVSRSDPESWMRMVLGSMPLPAWLAPDAPHGDVVISSRVRIARNLRGFRFPHHAAPEELLEVRDRLVRAVGASGLPLTEMRRLTPAERDYLVGCRLISPSFRTQDPSRALWLDGARETAVMVNEEDHLRVQALTPGWSIGAAAGAAEFAVRALGERLEFAYAEPWGHLTACPHNAGQGVRSSAMFHLIGLAHTKRIGAVLSALRGHGVVGRGLFGEGSRAVGAFFQVSMARWPGPDFAGACEYLMREERAARAGTPRREVLELTRQASEYAIGSAEIGLGGALRVLAWVRWAAALGWDGLAAPYREVDRWLSVIEVHGASDRAAASRRRASFLRGRLEG
jgi:protein arginine kinase